MDEITTEQALQFVSWLAQFDHGNPMPKAFVPTDIQTHLGITDVDVWLANVSCGFRGGWAYDDGSIFHGTPCPPRKAEEGDGLIGWNDGAGREIRRRHFADTEMRCFDRLRERYHALMRCKNADERSTICLRATRSQHEARPLVHGMIIDDSVARRDMKQIVMDYLTEASKKAERELLEATAMEEEEERRKKSGSKKSKCRAKQKRKKSKKQQHDDQDTLDDEKECQSGETSTQSEKQEGSALHSSTAEGKSIDTGTGKSILQKEMTELGSEPSVPMTPRPVENRICPNKDGPITEEGATRSNEPSTESLVEEIAQLKLSVQQVQLKSYIAETAREAAEERAAWLEGLLLDTIEERMLNEVTKCEIIDAIGVLASSGPKSAR